MKKMELSGIFSALLVSFHEDGSLNEAGTRAIVRHNMDRIQVDGLYVGGSTGENFLLSVEEKKRIFEIVAEETKGKVRLIAQVGAMNYYEAMELAKVAEKLGYDAISAVTPFYYKFSFEEIRDYYFDLAEASNLELIIYSIPFLTGVNMGIDEFSQLFSHPKIIGVKFTAGDFYLLERVRTAFPDKLIYAGFDEMLLPATSLAVDGAIGSTFNVNGLRAREIFRLTKEGKLSEAYPLQKETNDFISAILANGLYPSLKEILKAQGVDGGYSRKPMKSATMDQSKRAREIFHEFF